MADRMELARLLTGAIQRDDGDAVAELIERHPFLLHESARGVEDNWGPPMSYAANLGRLEIVERLHGMGARDLQHAFDRACLQRRIETARRLHELGARPERDAVMGPAETQSGTGMAFLLELGAEISDADGDRLAPVALLLETYCRNHRGKHRCLELFAEHGVELPDTPLFGCVVSQPWRVRLRRDDAFARLLLDRNANPNARASLRKRLRFVADESEHEYRDVTPLDWGERFHDPSWVNRRAMDLIAERGGRA